jgi:hypothetical protein
MLFSLADHFEMLGLSVAGVFTVAGIIDAFVYHGQRAIRKKIDLGKHRWVQLALDR